MNRLEREILDLYKGKTCGFDKCESYCLSNGLPQHGPLSFFNIGDTYEHDEDKIAFVGKNHWYDLKDVERLEVFPDSIFRDCRKDGADMFKERQRGYWSGLRKITDLLYPNEKNNAEKILSRLAITNLTKCNTSMNSQDTTPYFLTENCIEIFHEEIKILEPRHLILFTGAGYDPYVGPLNYGLGTAPEEITKDEMNIGGRSVRWWHREFSNGNRKMSLLRTRHPARAPTDFAEAVSDWIRKDR